MIVSIRIYGIGGFEKIPQELDALSKFNFIFGSNGTGKTTISRVIADESTHTSCRLTWKSGTKLDTMVYNHDFVERNFHRVAELKGVFTLGEKQQDTLDRIEAAKIEVDALTRKVEHLSHGLQSQDGTSGKKVDLSKLELEFKAKCWAQKQKHDPKLQGAFLGFRNSADKFKEKVLHEQRNSATLLLQAELETKAKMVFGESPVSEPAVSSIDTTKFLAHETNPILKKRVIGKEDVDISAMIKKLGNSDWVRTGRAFYDANDKVCPFCQQKTNESFAKSLNDYFDETYVNDSRMISELEMNYRTDAERIQKQLSEIIAMPSRFLDIAKLQSEKELLDTKINLNKQKISEKKKEASQIVELESVSNVVVTINSLIEEANSKIQEHNHMVSNLAVEQRTLTSQTWRFVIEELKEDLATYKKNKEQLDKAIASMEQQIREAEELKKQKETEIRDLEKQTTSVQPTIDAINGILASFGFNSFKLAKASNETSYKLLRRDGTDAKATLSEGEKTFLTFLYFYHLLKGSTSESGIATNRIVVFDDPVSSLDSEVLFIVSTLIKGLFDEVRSETGYIKQIFILTHNVYFHKEITYNPKRKEKALGEETFWIVRKKDLTSTVEKHDNNPIKTSYDLLWSEVRRTDRSKLTIQNTLRRILENYFKILGGIDLNQLSEEFDGKAKIACKSLVSWVNDGSHFANDDIYVSVDDEQVEVYLNVFKEIFTKTKHAAHYDMMMGSSQE